jgi:hypothetical protein
LVTAHVAALQRRHWTADNPSAKRTAVITKDLPPLDRALAFSPRDASGRLLLNAGVKVTDDRQRQELLQTPLFAEEHHCVERQRRLNAAMGQRLREGAALKDVVAALPHELHARGRALLQRRADESLYHFVYEAVHYSARHAWMTLALTEQTAAVLGWPQPQVDSLGRAALTMNVAIARLQDHLAIVRVPATPSTAPSCSPRPGWTMRWRWRPCGCTTTPMQRAGHCRSSSRRTSWRGSRAAMSPLAAAHEACSGAAGQLRGAGQRRDRHRRGARPARQPAPGGGHGFGQRQRQRRARAARNPGPPLRRQGRRAAPADHCALPAG